MHLGSMRYRRLAHRREERWLATTHTSAFQSLRSSRSWSRQRYELISSANVMQRGIGLMFTRSTPTIRLFDGMCLLATCSQPPGAAHKSIQHREFSRKWNFLLSCTSLYAARERKPCSLVIRSHALGQPVELVETTGKHQRTPWPTSSRACPWRQRWRNFCHVTHLAARRKRGSRPTTRGHGRRY